MYPQINARKLDWTVMVANMEVINPDMYTDRHKENVYAMTSFKVSSVMTSFCSCVSVKYNLRTYSHWCGVCLQMLTHLTVSSLLKN